MSATGCFPGRFEARRDNPRQSTCLRLIACPSNGIPRSTVRSIPTIPNGSSTWSNVRVLRWRPLCKDAGPCCTSGNAKMGAVHTAAKRSPRSQDGTTITRSGGRMAAVTPRTIGCCSTRPATAKSITPAVQRVYRTLSQGCFERLEPDIRKPICPVLRGGGDGNAAPLPDTMKLTVLGQFGKGLVQCEAVLGEQIRDQIERLKWSLWHGQVDKALGKIDALKTSIAPFEETYARFPRLIKALAELHTSIVHNRHVIPNYGERYHHGEAIATVFVESTVNEVVSKRFCKKQQMQWTKEGAHLLLQTRVRTLNGELGAIFKRWYPDMDLEVEEISVAA